MQAVGATVAWHTLRGRRETNQDSALVHELEDGRMLVALADGMGGHEGGAEASRRALEVLLESLKDGSTLAEAMGRANASVHAAASAMPVRNGMGTTLVTLLSGPTEYLVANVGDSRAYRVEDGSIRQITADHSFASEAIGKGMSQEEVDASPWRNALTRAIGPDPDVEVDVFGPFSTAERHRICLCTDGLYRVLSDERIKNMVCASAEVDGVPKRLVDLAYAEGSSDNITVAVVAVGDGRAEAHEAPTPEASTFQAPSDSETPPSPGAEASTASESRGRAEPPAGALSPPATDETSPARVRRGSVVSRAPGYPKASRRGGSIGETLGWIRWRHRRLVRLSQKRRLEVWGTAITILLAAVAAYMVLNVL